MRLFFIVLISCLLCMSYNIEAKTVGDIDQSAAATKVPDNKDNLNYQLGGTNVDPAIKKTGRLDKSDPLYGAIIKALGVTIVPAEGLGTAVAKNFEDATTVGLMELPYEKGQFVGWVQRENVYTSDSDENPKALLTIGLFKKDSIDHIPKSIHLIDNLIANVHVKPNEGIWSFDFAPYDLGQLGRAFGIRTMLEGCGAGVSLCSNTYLRLFVVQKGILKNVFTEAVDSYGNYAGDWHKDGTRDHTVEEQSATIHVVQNAKNSIPSLVMKLRKDKKGLTQTLTPSSDQDGLTVYKSNDKKIIDRIDDDEQ